MMFYSLISSREPGGRGDLYPAMEDRQLDLIIWESPAARSVRIDLVPFTLIGATADRSFTTPLRERRHTAPCRLRDSELELIVVGLTTRLD